MEFVVLGIVIVIGVLLWRATAGADFVITARPGTVRCKGNMAAGARLEIEEFFLRDLPPAGTWKVLGSRSPSAGLHLRFRGRMSDADRQRIRNFLLATLRG